MILAEHEHKNGEFSQLTEEERTRLTALGVDIEDDAQPNATLSEQDLDRIP